MAGSYSLSKFQKMARPKTAGERNEQLMMDKVGDTDNDGNNNNNIVPRLGSSWSAPRTPWRSSGVSASAAAPMVSWASAGGASVKQNHIMWPVLGRIWCMADFMFSLPSYFRQYHVRSEQTWPAVESINILNIS